MATPNGDFPVSMTLKADGDKLTGTTTGPEGDVAITNGKVDGKNVSFSVAFDFGGMPLTLSYKGVVDAGQIKFSIDVMGMAMDLVVKKGA